ncbi:hypothetical protein PoB_005740700 [Plakobranchus ocellatus]|uniref:Uncharacterized protein n=1 Tax=Plakobranchus ocellatus TaxID=259542 RepID=A0AAV4CHW7_9GAST|nr:hypothetical protein PoB_005740700 [Plakobranchus ocellatus]
MIVLVSSNVTVITVQPAGELLGQPRENQGFDFETLIEDLDFVRTSLEQGYLRLSEPPSGQDTVSGLKPATYESLQIPGRIRLPLGHQRR